MSDELIRPYEQRDGEPPVIDTSIAHSARVYDYVLGGKDNYPVDREAAEQMLNGWPQLRTSMQENRKFMHRAARYAAEQGLDQFIDIGTGIPTSPNLHEIVQAVTPSARVVYVDKDPIVFAHAAARLTGTPEGRISYLLADMGDPDAILGSPEVTGTLDLSRPVGLSVIAVLQFVLDAKAAYDLVRSYLDRLAPGSMLTITTVTSETSPVRAGTVTAEYTKRGLPVRDSTLADVEPFFEGLELVDPGVTLIHRWRPEPGTEGLVDDSEVAMYAGVARKP
ncbi:SAM-dependent methyltransferase [Actinacidiphila bryophytorum]|uniref:O-methyltransferase YrrM n=1 Tax=Actinacidiphila bryophytorum TaxID=1436133 RepID=A0A9W4H1H2_9ACTN|nr:SAM-dependent methyltransferase [Actinacidiphila bryophytorum]MBM9435049.1 SAM-dependent methyltransferase [Actinacidiphila bryophytorum]MBN6544557.1 SAM-dependent methyltransferase [Actinacidiphila bryophytorum]CAG7642755.1 Putative O-methyltransferase YrrM [Actinacidiphila bryophytorum]